MKKNYEAPRLIVSGNVIRDTLIGTSDGCEKENLLVQRDDCPGSVGYYL